MNSDQKSPTRIAGLALVSGLLVAQATHAQCVARSGPQAATVVELYTSEGCSSCPPADRWLSRIDPASPVVALAFHVDYWDRLGWTDTMASPLYTRRQEERSRATGGRFVYTPQVRINGRDAPDWSRLNPQAPAAVSPPPTEAVLELSARSGQGGWLGALSGTLGARLASSQPAVRLWLAVTESGLVSDVAAGENAGAQLRHDHVVRRWLGPFRADSRGDISTTVPLDLSGVTLRRARLVALAEQVAGPVVQAVSLPLARCLPEGG